MTKTFGEAAEAGLTAAAASPEHSTANSQEAHYQHFVKCLRLWEAMLPRKATDELSGQLLARGYYRMLGHLSEREMGWLSEMVLERCKWFPTVAECREIMAEQSYGNKFYLARRDAELSALGYQRGPSPALAHEQREMIGQQKMIEQQKDETDDTQATS